jgi:hypothetical protein
MKVTPRWLQAQQVFKLKLFLCVSLKYCDEYNGAGTNNWIPAKNNYCHNIRRKNTQQLNNVITLSNSFAVLDNLYELPDNSTTIPKVHKT